MTGVLSSQVWWYTARAGGIVAWALLAASVLWGLALSTRALRGRVRPSWMLDLHRYLGGLALVFVGVHVLTLVADSYVHFGLVEVLVPFTGQWHPAAVAGGVVGLYLLLAVQVTSLLRRRLPIRVWRATHYLSFPLFALTTVHALVAGTDMGSAVARWGVAAVGVAVTALTLRRLGQVEARVRATAGVPVRQARPGAPASRLPT